MTDFTLARYSMVLLAMVASIPVLAQPASGNQGAGDSGRTIRQDVEAAVRRNPANEAAKKLKDAKAAEKAVAKESKNAPTGSADNLEDANEAEPGVRRADLREWRLKHDEKRSQQVRS